MAKNLEFCLDAAFIQPLEQMLRQHGLQLGASEFHGNMVGLACSGYSEKNMKDWQNLLVGQHLAGHDAWPILDAMSGMIALIRRSLELPNFDFQLLLPATAGVAEQTTALADWCRGFTLGFSWNKTIVKEALEADAIEALFDIAQIADAESGGDTPESEERALVELEEYLRACVQLIYEAVHSNITQDSAIR